MEGCSDMAALWSALMGHVYCTTLSSATDKMVTVSGGGGKKAQDEGSPTKTHRQMGFKQATFWYLPSRQLWNRFVRPRVMKCVTWWIVVYCCSARLKKQPKTNACSKWANLLGLWRCFLRLSWVSLIQTTLTLDTDCYRNADIKTSVG